jgi:ribosomal protein RSM22 (predicted rRNA methylase)
MKMAGPNRSDHVLTPPDRCHFAARVARSRLHRLAKAAELSWEDEKFNLAVSRRPASAIPAPIIARQRKTSGRVTLKLCRQDGSAGEQLFSRRDGEVFKRAWPAIGPRRCSQAVPYWWPSCWI